MSVISQTTDDPDYLVGRAAILPRFFRPGKLCPAQFAPDHKSPRKNSLQQNSPRAQFAPPHKSLVSTACQMHDQNYSGIDLSANYVNQIPRYPVFLILDYCDTAVPYC